jgi:hypothetical protein
VVQTSPWQHEQTGHDEKDQKHGFPIHLKEDIIDGLMIMMCLWKVNEPLLSLVCLTMEESTSIAIWSSVTSHEETN